MWHILRKTPYIFVATVLLVVLLLILDNSYSKNNVQLPKAELVAPQPSYDSWNRAAVIDSLRPVFGNFKQIPKQFEAPILVALSHYPQLRNVPIHFTLRQQTPTPHRSQPYKGSLILPWKERSYFINISDNVATHLTPTLLKNLSFDAQVGVIGHELAHTIDYMDNSAWQIVTEGIRYALTSFRQTFEHRADSIAIEHGLGYQLKAWSDAVHPIFTADERGHLYFSPSEIQARLEEHFLYR